MLAIILYARKNTAMTRSEVQVAMVETYPHVIGTADGRRVIVETLKGRWSSHLSGKVAVRQTTLLLPPDLMTRLPDVIDQVEQDTRASCLTFAHMLSGVEIPDFPKNDDPNFGKYKWDWRFMQCNPDEINRLLPGTCVIYKEKADPTQMHWAVACGADRVLQIMGEAGPLCVSGSNTPIELYGEADVAIAEHPNVPSWYTWSSLPED